MVYTHFMKDVFATIIKACCIIAVALISGAIAFAVRQSLLDNNKGGNTISAKETAAVNKLTDNQQ